MFKAEKTYSYCWQRLVDASGKHIGHINELSTGDWTVSRLGHRGFDMEERLGGKDFSSGSRAAAWVWKNRFDLGEPFSLYVETEKSGKKTKVVEQLTVVEEPTTDLFWDYKK